MHEGEFRDVAHPINSGFALKFRCWGMNRIKKKTNATDTASWSFLCVAMANKQIPKEKNLIEGEFTCFNEEYICHRPCRRSRYVDEVGSMQSKVMHPLWKTDDRMPLADTIGRDAEEQVRHQIKLLDNPRREAHKNPLSVCNQQLLSMGLKPIRINEEILISRRSKSNWCE